MRLTEKLRSEIKRKVINSTTLNVEFDELVKKESELVREIVESQIPPEFKKLAKKGDSGWFRILTSVRVDNSVSAVRYWSSFTYVSFTPINIPMNFNFCRITESPVFKEAVEWKDKYDKIERELSAVLKSYKTIKALVKDHPYIEKHIPKTEVNYPLVCDPLKLPNLLQSVGYDETE